MKRYVRWAACLYPAEWRARYGPEFELLLDDAALRWSDLADVIRGAAIMRMTGWMTYGKMAVLSGLAGAILAGGIAFAIPDQYVCSAALALEKNAATTPWQLAGALSKANMKLLNRDALIVMIQDLDLYKKERQRLPVAEVAWNIFRKHVRVIPYDMGRGFDGQAFHIVFEYPDKYKAIQVVRHLTEGYQQEFPRTPALSMILENPILLDKPTSPVRLAYVIIGLIAGTSTGLLSVLIWRRTRAYAVLTVSIPRETKQFVDRQIAAGQFRDLGDYVRELIRADEERRK